MYSYRLVLLLVLSFYLFSPVIIDWWIEPAGTWYRPFIIWLMLIGVSVWLEQQKGYDEL